jgi:hypothetical protein
MAQPHGDSKIIHATHSQEIPSDEVKHTKAGARGVQSGGNAGAMGDPVADQSRHNYQVSRDTDMAQHAEMFARNAGPSPNDRTES